MVMVEAAPAIDLDGEPGMIMYQATQSFPLGGARSRSAAAAREEVAAARWDGRAVRLDVKLAARLAFVRLAEAQATRLAREEEVRLTRSASEIVRVRVASGAVSASSALGAETAAIEAEVTLAGARGDEAAARSALLALLGMEAGASLAATEPLLLPAAPEPLGDLVAEARRSRPELAAYAARERAAQDRAGAARARSAPVVTVGLGYMQDLSMADGVWAQLGVTLPIWSSPRSAAAAEAEDEAAALADDAASLGRSLESDVAARRAELVAARERAALVETRLVPQSRARSALATVEYARAQADLFSLLDAVRGEVRARLEWVRTTAESVRARALLDRALGR
jgi:outer membrane protein TolC